VPLVVLLSLPFLYVVVRKPVLRRLAVRNATRRKRETALVLLGSLLGTAIITGSLVVGDTLTASFRRAAYTHEGPIDELVQATGPTGPGVLADVANLHSPNIDGTLPMTVADAALLSTAAPPRAEPHGQVVEVDFAAARAFGRAPGSTGIEGPTPRPGHVAITKDVAKQLHASAGDTIVVSVYGRRLPVKVDRVLPRTGVAGFSFSPSSPAFNVFLTPGTVRPLAAGAPLGAPPPEAMVAVSNRGGVIDGSRLSGRVAGQIARVVGARPARIATTKSDTLKDAKATGKQFAQLFGGIGFFSVLAGVLLLVNIFVMLAQERKTELGMLRAVGLRRAGLVGTFSVEGWLYALASSMLGAVAGLALGRLIVWVASGIFHRPGSVFTLDLHYAAKLGSVVSGFSLGFLISLATVLFTSLSIARLNVIRAIRDLPDPPRTASQQLRSLILGVVLALVGAQVFVAGVRGERAAAILIGPALLAVGAVLVLRRWLPLRPVASVASAALLLYSIGSFALFPAVLKDAQIPVFVVLGVVLTAAAVALVSLNQDAIGYFLRRIGGGSRNMSLRLGLAYPLARKFRTGMILSMYSLVVFTLVFMTVFSYLFAKQLNDFTAKVAGGFNIEMSTNATNPVSTAEVAAVPGVTAVSAVSNAFGQWRIECATCDQELKGWPVSSFDSTFLSQGPPALSDRLPQYRDDLAAYRALAADPSAFIPSRFFLQTGGGPPKHEVSLGDAVLLKDPETGVTRTLHVIARAESGFGNPFAMVSPVLMNAVYGNRQSPNTLLIAVRRGVDADALATSLNGRFVDRGADAKSFRAIVSENLGQQKQFFRLMQGYLALGLLVGIAGLGVVMVRAVRERRRQIGVLRSLGFEAAAVRRAFMTESAFVAAEGIVIGTVLALVTAWRLVQSDTFGASLKFSVPALDLALLVVGTFVASLVATATPAEQAARIKPAVALRIAD
jgi:putative ABC transport system permease protein